MTDNSVAINKALKFASRTGGEVLLSDSGICGIRQKIVIPKGVRFTISNKVTVYNISHMDSSIHMFEPMNNSQLLIYGLATMNYRKGVGVYIDGANFYQGTETKLFLNLVGNRLKNQTGVMLYSNGNGVYGSSPINVLQNFEMQVNKFDTGLYLLATQAGNINDNVFKFVGFGNITSVVMVAEVSVAGGGVGKTSISDCDFIQSTVTNSTNARQCLVVKGNCFGNRFNFKAQDYGRYAIDTSFSDEIIYLDPYTQGNTLVLGANPAFVKDLGSGNMITSYAHSQAADYNMYGINSGVYPSGSINRPGGNESNYLSGANQKANLFSVSTSSAASTGLGRAFDNDPSSYFQSADANSQARTLTIALKSPVSPDAIGVEFEAKNNPRYCKIEARSVDSAKWYRITETDTSFINDYLYAYFSGKLITNAVRCASVGGQTFCDTVITLKNFRTIDSLRITFRYNNYEYGANHIGITKVWMTQYLQPDNVYLQAAGGSDTAFQKITFKGGLDMQGATIENPTLPYYLKYYQDIINIDTNFLYPGHYSFTSTTRGTLPASATFGTIQFNTTGIFPYFNGNQKASMMLYDCGNNLIWYRTYNGTAWTAWSSLNYLASLNDANIVSPSAGQFLKYGSGKWTTAVSTTSDISGAGTMATQNANNVSITGGTISGMSRMALPTTAGTNNQDIWLDNSSKNLKFRLSATNYTSLTAENNLSDISSAATARTNLGITANGVFTNTATRQVTNTTAESSIIPVSGVGSMVLPSNFFTAGKTVLIRLMGYFSTDAAAGNITVNFKCGSVTVSTTGSVSTANSLSNQPVDFEIYLTCFTTGTSGSFWSQGVMNYNTSNANISRRAMGNNSARTIDTTISNTLDLTWTWATASTNNILTITNAVVEVVN